MEENKEEEIKEVLQQEETEDENNNFNSYKKKQVQNKRKIRLIIVIILIIVIFVIAVAVIRTVIETEETYSIVEHRELPYSFSIEMDIDTNNLDDEKILEIAYDILEENLDIQNAEERFTLSRISKNSYDITCTFQQQYEGLKIYGRTLTMIFDYDFTKVYLSGGYVDISSDMDINFEINKLTIAIKYLTTDIEKIIYINNNDEACIAYHIGKTDYDWIVSGKTGEVLKQISNISY